VKRDKLARITIEMAQAPLWITNEG